MLQSVPTLRRLGASATIILIGLGLTSCSESSDVSSASESTTRTVDTAYGDIEVPSDPQRVVAVSYDTPWQLAAVGVEPVAMQDYSAYASEFTAEQQELMENVSTVGAFFELNIEAVMAAEPDLIVGDVLEIDEATWVELSKIAPTAIYEGAYRGDWRAIGAGVADSVGRAGAFQESAETYESELARLQSEYAEVLERPWAAIGAGDVEGGFSVLYPGGSVGALYFDDLGASFAPGIPEEEDGEKGWMYISPELTQPVLGKAEIIVGGARPDGEFVDSLQLTTSTPLFQELPAARSGDVYSVYSTVTDYGTALAWLDAVEETVLEPLARD
ncbi:ABC transporter substrate-binding protein [Rhodococcus artemisiae]|uniref:ABC transporter substrate-binding protein n=1 Tax=Rhodococcus artemisiae TaxID=714159 RepID=A0ABU7LHM1_9NOCA|nr:ABC transporter substrate-binding protein [Rhodococcus artemisiae]MEE2061063.1 ABC transporter substrate-binding protein [Rhodococcus artemisiae]